MGRHEELSTLAREMASGVHGDTEVYFESQKGTLAIVNSKEDSELSGFLLSLEAIGTRTARGDSIGKAEKKILVKRAREQGKPDPEKYVDTWLNIFTKNATFLDRNNL